MQNALRTSPEDHSESLGDVWNVMTLLFSIASYRKQIISVLCHWHFVVQLISGCYFIKVIVWVPVTTQVASFFVCCHGNWDWLGSWVSSPWIEMGKGCGGRVLTMEYIYGFPGSKFVSRPVRSGRFFCGEGWVCTNGCRDADEVVLVWMGRGGFELGTLV